MYDYGRFKYVVGVGEKKRKRRRKRRNSEVRKSPGWSNLVSTRKGEKSTLNRKRKNENNTKLV